MYVSFPRGRRPARDHTPCRSPRHVQLVGAVVVASVMVAVERYLPLAMRLASAASAPRTDPAGSREVLEPRTSPAICRLIRDVDPVTMARSWLSSATPFLLVGCQSPPHLPWSWPKSIHDAVLRAAAGRPSARAACRCGPCAQPSQRRPQPPRHAESQRVRTWYMDRPPSSRCFWSVAAAEWGYVNPPSVSGNPSRTSCSRRRALVRMSKRRASSPATRLLRGSAPRRRRQRLAVVCEWRLAAEPARDVGDDGSVAIAQL